MLIRKIYRSLRSVLLIFVELCVLRLCVLTFWVPCGDFRIQTMVGSSLSPVLCKRAYVLSTLFVFACGQRCPTHIVFVFLFVFVWFLFFVLCDLRCQFLWIVHFVLPLQYSLSYIDINTLNVK